MKESGMIRFLLFTASVFVFHMAIVFETQAQQAFEWSAKPDNKKIELWYAGKLLTAYCYFDSTAKPVLFPIKTFSGKTITRGYPIMPRVGERTDHPHHVGLWFNYESVNGLDFWNNSAAIPKERKHLYGSIRHQNIILSKAEGDRAELQTLSHWVDMNGNVLIEEVTRFVFLKTDNNFIIDRTANLKAMVDEVKFKDVKDGLIALRVARALEMPSEQKSMIIDASGKETSIVMVNKESVTGMYSNAEGIKGDSVWSTRSKWATLTGEIDGELVSIGILDHPENRGYPTYWHARGYGLFAANPLGAKVFSKGRDEMSLSLKQNETAAFTYRIVIRTGTRLTSDDMDELFSR